MKEPIEVSLTKEEADLVGLALEKRGTPESLELLNKLRQQFQEQQLAPPENSDDDNM